MKITFVKKPIALIMSLIILATVLFSVGMVAIAAPTELSALNLKVSSTSTDARVMFTLPIDKGSNVEFSFDMKIENGDAPEFIIVNGTTRETITPVKVDGYRYTFRYVANDTTYNTVQRWYFNFAKRTSDVVISNMELYKTDSDYENKLTENLVKGVYGENGDFNGWDYNTQFKSNVSAGNITYIRNYSGATIDNADLTGTAIINVPLDYFEVTNTELTALNLKVSSTSSDARVMFTLPIDKGSNVEFSFDMKIENGDAPEFIIVNGTTREAITPAKIKGNRYTFHYVANDATYNTVQRWYFNFAKRTSDVVISNMKLYKTDSDYENRLTDNLVEGVYGENGDFDGWNYTTHYKSNVSAGNILYIRNYSNATIDNADLTGTATVIVPSDYFEVIKEELTALNLKVSSTSSDARVMFTLPIAKGSNVEFSFDMKIENGDAPEFIIVNGSTREAITPAKIKGSRYTFHYVANDTTYNTVQRWYFNFAKRTSDVVISNMELYKTDSDYENKLTENLMEGVYGENGDFDGWDYNTQYNSNVSAGNISYIRNYSSATIDNADLTGTATVIVPLDYFEKINTKLTALNLKVSSTSSDARVMFTLPIDKGSNVEFSFDMKIEKGDAPEFIIVNGMAREAITPVKVEGYRYTFRYVANDTTYNTVQRWYFNFAKRTSDVVISNMELYKTDSDYENRLTENLMKGVYGENGDFNGWNYKTQFKSSVLAGNITYIRNYNGVTIDNDDLTGTATVSIPVDYFYICESPNMAQIKLNKSNDKNSLYLLLNCKKDSYYELSYDLNYEENKGLYLVGFKAYDGTMTDISPISVENYRYTFRFKANYNSIEENKGFPFAIVFDGSSIASGTAANAYVAKISLSEYSDDTYSKKVSFENFAAGINGYGKTGNFDDWNGKIVLEYDKEIDTTTAAKGDIWLKSDSADATQDIFNCEIVSYDAAKFPPIKKMLHIVSSAKGYGRDIQLYLDCQKDKYYEFSFKMKLEDGEIPKFDYKNDKNENTSISPVKVKGNKYTFNFKAIDSNIVNVGQRFRLDFDQVLSEVNVSCFELYETDSNFKNANKSVNLALGDTGYGIDGCFSDWNSYLGKDGKGGAVLFDNYDSSSNKPYFYMEIVQMKEGFIDKSTKAGEHMIKFTSYSEESSKAVFFFDCKQNDYYELSFYLRKETGDIPTFFTKNSYGAEYDIEPYKVEGCKYTFRFRAMADVQEFVMCFKKKFDAATISYIVLNKSDDFNYSNIDTSKNLAAGTNGYGLNGDFDDWNENYTKTSTGLGKIQLDGVGSDKLKVSFTKIPENYFDYKIYTKPQMLHFKHEADTDAERFVLRLNLPNDPDATNYVFSYRLKLKEGLIGYIQAPGPSGNLTTITPAYNYGDTYYFHFKNSAGYNDSFRFNFSFTNKGVDGYITDLQLYAADGDYNIISKTNLASIYGTFMDWSDRGSSKLGGITTLSDSVEIVGLEEWKDGFFDFPDFIPYLIEEENWWSKYDLTDKVDTGTIIGSLKNSAGKLMKNTTVQVYSLWDDCEYKTATNDQGAFKFSNLPIGEYEVSVIIADGTNYSFDETIYLQNKGDVVSLTLVLNEDITIEYIDSESFEEVDEEPVIPTKKVYKKKLYRKRINSGSLPMIAWIGISVGSCVVIASAIILWIIIRKKKRHSK